jgi:hypothetical protein
MSSGLAAGVTLTQASRGRSGEYIIRGGPAPDFIFVQSYVIIGLRFVWCILYYKLQFHPSLVQSLDDFNRFVEDYSFLGCSAV